MSQIYNNYLYSTRDQLGDPLKYAWDAWNYTDYFLFDDDELLEQFTGFSDLANCGYCLAVSELIAARFGDVMPVRKALEFVDAAWLTMIDRGFCDYGVFPRLDWQGLVHGPIRASLLISNDSVFDTELDGQFALRSCWATNLARHVFSDRHLESFESWRRHVLNRLGRHHLKRSLPQGDLFSERIDIDDPTAPITFIVEDEYSKDDVGRYLTEYKATFDATNPWLRTEQNSDLLG